MKIVLVITLLILVLLGALGYSFEKKHPGGDPKEYGRTLGRKIRCTIRNTFAR
jgi:hypothetical protein